MSDVEKMYPPLSFKSKVWKHYGFYKKDGRLDKTDAICKLCRASVKYTGSTTNLISHLKRRHGVVVEEASASAPASPASCSDSPVATSSKSGKKSIEGFFHAPLANNSTRSTAITDAIALFICKDIQPYSVTENEGFKHLLHVLEPRYKIPNRKLFSDKQIPALYDKTRVFNEAHTGNNLAVLLQDVCREWKIEEKSPALVTDNARNMILAGAGAKMDPHVRCIAHKLNLASQKAFKVDSVSVLVVKVRKLVTFFHKSPKATEVLREIQTQLHLPNHKLIHDVSTRWNSTLDMLERFWEQQPAVLNTLLSRKIKRREAMASLTEDDMTLIPEIIKLMSPLKVATTLLTLDPRFKDLAFLDDSDAKDMVFMKITTEVVQMNGEEEVSDTAMPNEDQATGTFEEDQTAETEGNKSPSKEDKTDDVPPKKKTAMDQMFGDFLSARPPAKTIREKAKDEILKYRERDTLGLDGDVLQWWRLQVDLPPLSALAKRYLSIPATSVPAERVFSTAGDIVTAQRSLLHPDHVDQLIFLKKNL
ncbi:zinc finger BED domain-containing protein 4-like [Xyrauchen texanus]|uniref:zinc finger BED domain-containing protein 4-like n=1 Tax=Xyrauchen texanus TaxID=154827 RepID=UPI002241CECB|nr:zinc finger BED domain-containing protein 4-like [Xyrauchen texanus]